MRKQSQNYFIPLPTIQLSNSSMMQQPSTTTTKSSSISMSTYIRATQTDDLSSTAELYQLAAHLHRLTGELVRACQAQNEAQQVTEMTMDVVVAPAAQTVVVETATVHSLSLDDVNVDCMVVVSQMSKRLEQMINMDESVPTPTLISSPLLVTPQRANSGTIAQRLSLEPRPRKAPQRFGTEKQKNKKKKTTKTGRKITKQKTKSTANKLKLPRGNINVDKHIRDYLESLIDVDLDEANVLDLTPNPNIDVEFDDLSNSSSNDSFATANMGDDSIMEC
ncbi:hypothetical protein I4U23_017161 [Adineta vaga]|nr:hypothetical protein I4U23_017161 [Adineta vaga]